MISTLEIAWLAGLLEGEGCFYIRTQTNIAIALEMTDEDIVSKVRGLIAPNRKINIRQNANRKTSYVFRFEGSLVAQWCMTLYPLMGRRRKEKIRELLAFWKANERRVRNSDVCKNGHQITPGEKCKICMDKYLINYFDPETALVRSLAKAKKISLDEARKILESKNNSLIN